MNAPARTFAAVPAARSEEPLSIGMVGPPGGGKTLSSLRVAKGIQSVRGGDIVLIDTEGGRSKKYADMIPFNLVEFKPPCRSHDFLDAIKQQLASKPAAIIVDSLSDEHEGEGGYLEWHDEMIPKMGNNEWAAWAKPKASRKRLITGLLHIKTPMIFTFRAREKTKQGTNTRGKTEIINIGWQPVAPLEIVHALDLTCILPPRADGVPVWKSDKIGEDFIIKLPNYLKPFIAEGAAMSEEMGAAFARWSKGSSPSPRPTFEVAAADQAAASVLSEPSQSAAASVPSEEDYIARWEAMLEEAAPEQADEIARMWNEQSKMRAKIWPDEIPDTYTRLRTAVTAKVKALRESAQSSALRQGS